MYRTTRPLALVAWPAISPCAFTLPAGSRVTLVRGLSGTDGDGFTVESVAQLAALTGNAHDAAHRYVGVPADAIEGDTEAERADLARIAANEAAKAAQLNDNTPPAAAQTGASVGDMLDAVDSRVPVGRGAPHPAAPDDYWQDDETGAAVCAHCAQRAATLADVSHSDTCAGKAAR